MLSVDPKMPMYTLVGHQDVQYVLSALVHMVRRPQVTGRITEHNSISATDLAEHFVRENASHCEFCRVHCNTCHILKPRKSLDLRSAPQKAL
jgi:hypothetical protein